MAVATHIKFGDNLGVTDEGSGVIRVDAGGGGLPPAGIADGGIPIWDAETSTWVTSATQKAAVDQLAVGSEGDVLKTTGGVAAWGAASGGVSAYAHYRGQFANGVNGGTAAAGWNQRPLNVEVEDDANLGTLASNRVTLIAGTYRVRAYGVVWAAGNHQLRLRNITDTVTVLSGLSVNTQANTHAPTALLDGRFTIAAGKALELQSFTAAGQASTNGLGFSVSSGEPEIYSELEIWKVS
jgi:hypothetical protein